MDKNMKKLLVLAACFALITACESPETSQDRGPVDQETGQSSVAVVQPSIERQDPETFVLVHGSAVGGYVWKFVAPLRTPFRCHLCKQPMSIVGFRPPAWRSG